jgi:hypothetical protein
MAIRIFLDSFRGISPRVDRKLLPENGAQTAQNCRLESGKITPILDATTVAATCAAGTQSLFLWKHGITQEWLTSLNAVDYAVAPIVDDDLSRIYYTDLTQNPSLRIKGYVGNTASDRSATLTIAPNLTATPVDRLGGLAALFFAPYTLTVGLSVNAQVQYSDGTTGGVAFVSNVEVQKSMCIIDPNSGAWRIRVVFPQQVSAFEQLQLLSKGGGTVQLLAATVTNYTVGIGTNNASVGVMNDGSTFLLKDAFGVYGVAQVALEFGQPQLAIEGNYLLCNLSGVVALNVDWMRNREVVSYRQTLVDDWGEEGPASTPTDPMILEPWQMMILNNADGSPATSGGREDHTYQKVSYTRVYRTRSGANEGSIGTDYGYLPIPRDDYPSSSAGQANLPANALPSPTSNFNGGQLWIGVNYGNVDVLIDGELGTQLPLLWNPPKDLWGIVTLPQGFCAAIRGNGTICFSGKNRPNSWPWRDDYRVKTEDPPVGLAVQGQDLYVITKGNPYLITGSEPNRMSVYKIALPQGCVSKGSICTMQGRVLYASADGLVGLQGGSGQLLTESYFTRDQWQALNPWTLILRPYDSGVVGFFTGGGGLLFDFDKGLIVTTHTLNFTGAYSDTATDTLYLVAGTNIQEWDTGNPTTAIWKSKQFIGNRLAEFTAARILADGYPVTIQFFADGVAAPAPFPLTITAQDARRIPKQKPARNWELSLSSTAQIDRVIVGRSMSSLAPEPREGE